MVTTQYADLKLLIYSFLQKIDLSNQYSYVRKIIMSIICTNSIDAIANYILQHNSQL